MARQLDADLLLLLTDVDAVYADWGLASARPLANVQACDFVPGDFPAGSMRPKVEAAVEFVRASGKPAAIGKREEAVKIVGG